MLLWRTSRRQLSLERPLVMAILNVTPDSFSDGGHHADPDAALRRVGEMIEQGADIIDIGGESTRPGGERVSAELEIGRVVPVVEALAARFDIPISVDTSKSHVARAAIDAGAEIINDISGLRFDTEIANVAARTGAGLVLMHSRGDFETMHSLPPVEDIFADVTTDFERSVSAARANGVNDEQIVLDIGIGFSKTADQNLALLANLGKLVSKFPEYPILVGTSRKSFLGKILGDAAVDARLYGSLASIAVAVWNGAKIVRVHDIRETVEALKVVKAIKAESFT